MSETAPIKRFSYTKIAIIVVAVIVALFIPIIPIKYSYDVEEKREVPVNYKYDHGYTETLVKLLPPDWELQYVCTIENVDAVGGTFTVNVTFYDKDQPVYSTSDSKYIGPGQKATFNINSSGLSYSTDWKERYKVIPVIIPPTKIETHLTTKYGTKYVSLFQLFTGGS